ncbi:MAG: ABC transporter permease subunit [Planctomycetes bacterium]|nr:ABC transporter permease subunit [Planctomycetota bacterium]
MVVLALARLTFADTIRQPTAWLMTGVSIALIALSTVFGLFNFEEMDRMRMLATAGVAVAVINGLFLAVVGTSQAIHDEIASRTALTLFAKPLGRGQFLVGKVLGVWSAVVASCAVIAGIHVLALLYAADAGFDSHAGHGGHEHHEGHDHGEEASSVPIPWRAIAAAHALGAGHSAVLACIAAVLALRFGLVANIIVCFSVFVVGHLLESAGSLGGVVVPALALFSIDDCIQLEQPVSWAYLGMTALYTALFCAGWLSIGLAFFKRQDIP